MLKIACTFLLLAGLLSLSYAQSYDKLKEIQSVSSNKDFIKLSETLGNSLGAGRIMVRSGTICDGKVEEDRLLVDLPNRHVEYLRIMANESDLNFETLSLPSKSGYIKIKEIYNCDGFFIRDSHDKSKYNRMLSSGNVYELTLLNNATLDKSAPWMKYLKEAFLYAHNQSIANKDQAKAAYYKSEMKKLELIFADLSKSGEYSGQIGDFSKIEIRAKNKNILDSVYYENKFGFSGYVKIEFPAELELTRKFYCDDFFNWSHLKGKNRSFEVSLRKSGENVFLEPISELGKYLYAADAFSNLFKIPLKSINGIDANSISPEEFKKLTDVVDELNAVMMDGTSYKIRKLDTYDKVVLGGAIRIGISPNIFF